MHKPILFAFLLFFSSVLSAQQDILLFKKGSLTLNMYTKDSYIAFQISNRAWYAGFITRIKGDSFYVKPLVVRYSMMGADTANLQPMPFVLADLYAMPKPGVLIDYGGPDGYHISGAGGHVHWYWIKAGWLFRTGGAGYVLLDIVNGLFRNELAFSIGWIYGAGVFAIGELLKHSYKLYYVLGKKYHFESIPTK
jgi:hypothetical protein